MIPSEDIYNFMLQQAEVLASELGVTLDGSEESLKHVDTYLSEYSTKMDIPGEKTFPSIAYVGNVIMANIGGSWKIEEVDEDITLHLGESHNEKVVSLMLWFTEKTSGRTPTQKPTSLYLELKKSLGLSPILNSERKEWNSSPEINSLFSIFQEAQKEVENQTEVSVDQIGKGIVLVFSLIAGADGKIDEKEVKAFNKYLSNEQGTRSGLFKTAVGIMMNDPDLKNSMELGSPILISKRLMAVRESAEKFFPDECEIYCRELYEMAVDVAKSSGGFLGIKSIDKSEEAALKLVQMALQVR